MIVWWISSPRCTFSIVEENGMVTEVAPISKWALGKPIDTVLNWWRSKGADDIRELGKRITPPPSATP